MAQLSISLHNHNKASIDFWTKQNYDVTNPYSDVRKGKGMGRAYVCAMGTEKDVSWILILSKGKTVNTA